MQENVSRMTTNEPPRSKLRGIKVEFAEANPPSLFILRRVRPAIHPCSKLQGILAKANKKDHDRGRYAFSGEKCSDSREKACLRHKSCFYETFANSY